MNTNILKVDSTDCSLSGWLLKTDFGYSHSVENKQEKNVCMSYLLACEYLPWLVMNVIKV